MPSCFLIEAIFNRTFSVSENTRLIGGAAEPYYQPADANCRYHRIFYREDFVASSLHECAHWLVAGEVRRLLPDWGYWYAPDGRDQAQQALFEQLEVKPQAVEWLLSCACRLPFAVSLDNHGESAGDGAKLKDSVYARAQWLCKQGLSGRTRQFFAVLAQAFGGALDERSLTLSRKDLDSPCR